METIHGNDAEIISLSHLYWEHEPGQELRKGRRYFNKPNKTLVLSVITSLGAHAFLLLLPRTTLEPIAPSISTTLSIRIVHAPKITRDTFSPDLQPKSEPAQEPEPNKNAIKDSSKKSTSTIISEHRSIDFSTDSIRNMIQDQTALDNLSPSPDVSNTQHTHYGDVFDPRLRETLLGSRVNSRQDVPQAMQVTSNVYGTMVEIKNGPCFMPREATAANEGVNWYRVKCNKGNTEEDQIMRNLKNTHFVK